MAPVRRLEVAPTTEQHHQTKGLIRLTMACNERCPFCNVPAEDYPRPTPPDEEIASELEAFLASGEQTLTISGGEPTLLPDRLVALVRAARAGGVPYVELQTNAILIDDAYARDLADAGLTSAFVSLLSDEAALHDELAGLEGAFELCLRGIDALDAVGIAVTLNPVVARQTQDRVCAYVRFVAERLPGVRAISLSAVQPHGRAAGNAPLMPDYALLGPEIARAHDVAAEHSIRLLNPYCGVPLCVGWASHMDRSVEAVEAEAAWRVAVSDERRPLAHGVDNAGNKRHGLPCRDCALRTRCGGAWHAYWDARGGSGIGPPERRVEPWFDDAVSTTVEQLAAQTSPTRWLLLDGLDDVDVASVVAAGCTDLAVATSVADVAAPLTDALRQLTAENARREPQLQVRTVVGLRSLGSFQRAFGAVSRLADAGVDGVRLLVRGDDRHERFIELLRQQTGLDVALVEP